MVEYQSFNRTTRKTIKMLARKCCPDYEPDWDYKDCSSAWWDQFATDILRHYGWSQKAYEILGVLSVDAYSCPRFGLEVQGRLVRGLKPFPPIKKLPPKSGEHDRDEFVEVPNETLSQKLKRALAQR